MEDMNSKRQASVSLGAHAVRELVARFLCVKRQAFMVLKPSKTRKPATPRR